MIKKITKKKLFHLFFILFVSVGVFIYLWRFINSYLSRSRATSTSATLSILPSSTNMSVNETKKFQLKMQFSGGNASEKIHYLKVVVNFPKNYLELVENVDTTLSGLDRQIKVDGPVAANSSGRIVIELGAIDSSSGPSTQGPDGRPTTVNVADIKFKLKATSSDPISITIDEDNYQIVNNDSNEIEEVSINNSQITVGALRWNITLQAVCQTPSKVLKPETKLRMFRILWPWVNPNGYSPWDFNCRFDSEEGNNSSTHFMEIKSENPLNNTQGIYVGLELPVRDNKKAACSEGVAFEPYEITPSVPNICSNIPPSGDYICFGKYFNPYNFMARWSYNRLAPGNYTIKVRIPDEYCYNPPSTRTPTPTSTSTSTSNGTITPTPTSTSTSAPNSTNLALNLSLRFQGIVNQCPSNNKKIKVKVKLGGKTDTDYQQADFSCENGKWNGSVSFQAPAGSGYSVYVKGEKHLQKKICDNTPLESRLGPGTYNCRSGQITLNSGTNNLNFTGIVNLYGDLPVGGEQDGVINSLDSSFIRNNLGKNDPQVLHICDGNLDGICDTQDWSMLIMALSIKGDEL